jgi:hypothetical protein
VLLQPAIKTSAGAARAARNLAAHAAARAVSSPVVWPNTSRIMLRMPSTFYFRPAIVER